MLTIYKYKVVHDKAFQLPIPQTAKILDVQLQHGEPQVWVMLDPMHTIAEPRCFIVRMTGENFSNKEAGTYIGTYQDGPFVLHLFELTAPIEYVPKIDRPIVFGDITQ